MIRVRILLRGGHVYETHLSADSPSLEELRRVVGGGAGGLVQLKVEQDGGPRGLAIPASQIVAIETEPPVEFPKYGSSAVQPAPYIRIPQFLTKEENEAVMAFALRNRPAFQASTVEGGKKGYRHSQVLFAFDDLDVDFKGRVVELLPEVTAYFGLPLPADYTFEMQMTTHGDGGHFKIHNDNGSPGTASRFLTYVYYFHGEPAGFSGGLLRLYDDSRVDASTWVPVATYAEIKPENNMLLFFPSRHFHEVLPTLSRTGEFADGRFTLNGWIRNPAMPKS
jgi:SM-20-related protein